MPQQLRRRSLGPQKRHTAIRMLTLRRHEDEVSDHRLGGCLHQVPVAIEVDRFNGVVNAPAGRVGGGQHGRHAPAGRRQRRGILQITSERLGARLAQRRFASSVTYQGPYGLASLHQAPDIAPPSMPVAPTTRFITTPFARTKMRS